MALQRIDTAYGPNPIRFNGNVQPQATGNVYFGNVSYAFASVYSNRFEAVGNIQATSTTTGALKITGGASISSGNLYISGSAGNAIVTTGAIQILANTTSGTSANGLVISRTGSGSADMYIAGNIIPFTANATYNIGAVASWWGTYFGVSTQAKYADLAENYQADAQYEPGTVLEFGGENEVTIAEDGTRRVAGVVSTNPAHLMNGGLTGENVVAIALQGRTPCRVRGKISKGDMLISAGAGYARPDNSPQLGAVIGKALEDFDGLEGVIEVVVGRL
jgi:hypothetical protein